MSVRRQIKCDHPGCTYFHTVLPGQTEISVRIVMTNEYGWVQQDDKDFCSLHKPEEDA